MIVSTGHGTSSVVQRAVIKGATFYALSTPGRRARFLPSFRKIRTAAGDPRSPCTGVVPKPSVRDAGARSQGHRETDWSQAVHMGALSGSS